MRRRVLVALALTAQICLLSFTATLLAKPPVIEVTTTFENGEQIDPVFGLVVGASPARALLTGGSVEIRFVRSAYNSPPHGWVFDENESGEVEFETPLREVTFFAAVRAPRGVVPNGQGFVTLLDEEGEVIDHPVMLKSHEPGAKRVVFKNGAAIPLVDGHPQDLFSVKPIGTLIFTHSATGQSFLSLDDLVYRVPVKDDDDEDEDE